ncbi:unnamed protein product [marine sediment metagenome]|uniref:Uncharacterized protein n=1 Tax=marine sediment metagenome TaxID=412755 RepID=X1JPX8_9ZZZZ
MDYIMMFIAILSTIGGLYGLRLMLTFKREVLAMTAKQKHLDRINKLSVRKLGIKAKQDASQGDLGDAIGGLMDNLDADDIDDLPIPSWLKPLAKGYIEKMVDKSQNKDEYDGQEGF